MKRIRIIGLAVAAVFAISAVAAASASATQGPYFKVAGATLTGKKTIKVTSVAKEYVLEGEVFTVKSKTKCKKLKLNATAFIEGTTPGTGREVLEYEECTVEGNGSACEVENHKIVTNEVEAELAYSGSGRTGNVLTVYKPVSGSTFVTIKYKGTCTITSAAVEGTSASEAANGKGEVVKVGAEPAEEAKGESISKKAASIAYYTEPEVTTERKAALKFFGSPSTLEGIAVLELEGGPVWGVSTV